jgi:phage-related protein
MGDMFGGDNVLSEILSKGTEIISSLVSGIGQALPELIPAAMDIISNLANDLAEQIPTLVKSAADLLIGLVTGLTNPDSLNNLIDSAINIIMALVDGLIKALPKLIEAAPVIITNLVEALVRAIPKLLVAAGEIIMALAKGIYDNLPKILESAAKIIGELVSGIIRLKNDLFKAAVQIIERFRDGIKKLNPAEWGKDLVESLARGIRNAVGKVKDAVKGVANTIREFLHFSEPDIGPLADFHSYAPDMMKLFAEGIKDNTRLVTDQIQKSFDFSDVIADQNVNISGQKGGVVINVYGAEGQDEEKLAEIVSEKLMHEYYKAGAVYA